VKNKPNYEQKNAKYRALEMDSKSAGTLVQQGIPALLPLPNTPYDNSICIGRIERAKEAKREKK
jgi:hypothetical protein